LIIEAKPAPASLINRKYATVASAVVSTPIKPSAVRLALLAPAMPAGSMASARARPIRPPRLRAAAADSMAPAVCMRRVRML